MVGKQEIKVVKSDILEQYAQNVISTIFEVMENMVRLTINVNYAIMTKLLI